MSRQPCTTAWYSSAPGLVEEGGDLLVGHGLDAIDAQQRRLAAEGLNLLDEPLVALDRLGRLGQDPTRAPQPHAPPFAAAFATRRPGAGSAWAASVVKSVNQRILRPA